jgi:hypothetical protein
MKSSKPFVTPPMELLTPSVPRRVVLALTIARIVVTASLSTTAPNTIASGWLRIRRFKRRFAITGMVPGPFARTHATIGHAVSAIDASLEVI